MSDWIGPASGLVAAAVPPALYAFRYGSQRHLHVLQGQVELYNLMPDGLAAKEQMSDEISSAVSEYSKFRGHALARRFERGALGMYVITIAYVIVTWGQRRQAESKTFLDTSPGPLWLSVVVGAAGVVVMLNLLGTASDLRSDGESTRLGPRLVRRLKQTRPARASRQGSNGRAQTDRSGDGPKVV